MVRVGGIACGVGWEDVVERVCGEREGGRGEERRGGERGLRDWVRWIGADETADVDGRRERG